MSEWDNRYRQLDEGEIIEPGDECLTDRHLGWRKAVHGIGTPAPSPLYTSHRMYRRSITGALPRPAGWGEGGKDE